MNRKRRNYQTIYATGLVLIALLPSAKPLRAATLVQGDVPTISINDLNSGQLLQNVEGLPNEIAGVLNGYLKRFTSIRSEISPELDKELGSYLGYVRTAMDESIGVLNIADPWKTRTGILSRSPDSSTVSGLTPTTVDNALGVSLLTTAFNQTILSQDAQNDHQAAMQGIIKSIQNNDLFASRSLGLEKNALQSSQSVTTASNASQQSYQNSTQRSTQSATLSESAKKATSTQDAVKFLAQQNVETSGILSNQSNQLAQAAVQTAGLSRGLVTLSSQSTVHSKQLKELSALSGDQAVSLRSIQLSSAVSNLNLDQISKALRAEQQVRDYQRNSQGQGLSEGAGYQILKTSSSGQ